MTAQETYFRSELRQLMNEAGINKNTLKDMVKEVLKEELKKAIDQAVHETNWDIESYTRRNVDKLIKEEEVTSVLRDKITDQVVGNWFHRLKVSVDVADRAGNSIVAQEEKER